MGREKKSAFEKEGKNQGWKRKKKEKKGREREKEGKKEEKEGKKKEKEGKKSTLKFTWLGKKSTFGKNIYPCRQYDIE